MTDRNILARTYELLKASQEADMGVSTDEMVKETIHFIEEEWQKRDECGLSESDQALYLEEANRLRGELDEELYNNLPRVD